MKNFYEILTKAKSGDKEARLMIIEKYKPILNKCSNKYSLKCYDKDDIAQEGTISILKALEKYDLAKGIKSFDSYAINSIVNNINYLTRGEAKRNNESSLNTPNDSGLEAIDLIIDPKNFETELEEASFSQEINTLLSTLSNDDREFIIEVYFKRKGNLSKYCADFNLNYAKTRRRLITLKENLKNSIYQLSLF